LLQQLPHCKQVNSLLLASAGPSHAHVPCGVPDVVTLCCAVQVRVLLPGHKTVLGDAAADAELFVTDTYTTVSAGIDQCTSAPCLACLPAAATSVNTFGSVDIPHYCHSLHIARVLMRSSVQWSSLCSSDLVGPLFSSLHVSCCVSYGCPPPPPPPPTHTHSSGGAGGSGWSAGGAAPDA
jgi:hypothetical protein